uniref:Uncharacterized protein n=1 Tax=Romanomermis culicivorax TaxID=13658 RepID=A0A915IH01_ROMCU
MSGHGCNLIRRSITIDQSENFLSSTNRLATRRTPPFRRTTTTPLLTNGIDRLMFEHLRQHHRRMTATAQQFGRDYLIRKVEEAGNEENNNNMTSADCSDLPEFEDFLSDEEDERGRHDSFLKKNFTTIFRNILLKIC